MTRKIQTLIIFFIFTVLVIAPIINLGNQYIVGGDDMKLYYIFPELYLRNYSFSLISDNTLAGALTGYASVAYFAPFYFVIYIIKFIPLNTQALMYGLNFAFGFYFLYRLIGLYTDNLQNNWKVFVSKILASIFFVFSPFLSETLYSHQLMFIYLVSVLPSTVYFFIKSVRSRNIKFIFISVLIFSIFSTTYASLPVSAAFLITIIPLLIYEFWLNKALFIKYGLVWCSIFIGLNFYWIIHLLYGTFHNTGLTNSVALFSSGQVQQDNIRIIAGVARQYSPLNQIFISIKYGVYNLTVADVVRSLFLVTIIFAGFFIGKLKNNTRYSYLAVMAGLLLSWFFFSPNFGNWGPQIFVSITEIFPLFGMFRNMQDKFALSLAFFYSLSFGISLSIITTKIKSERVIKMVFVLIGFVLLLNTPRIINPNIPDRDGLSRISGEFNPDFLNLIDYVKNIDNSSRIMWIPLNFPTYANIQDINGNFYSGLSPLRILANKSDFAGKFSFLTQNDVYLGDKVLQWLKEENNNEVGRLAQTLNIQYIILDHQQVSDNLQPFYYGGEELPILKSQDSDFKAEMLGNKLQDFGSRYSLYEINTKYQNSKIVSTSLSDLSYYKVDSSEYKINIQDLQGNTRLIFLDPFNSDWTLYITKDGRDKVYKRGGNNVIYNYANEWELSFNKLKTDFGEYSTVNPDGSLNIEIKLYFEPDKLNNIGYAISVVTLVGCVFVVFINHKKYD